MNSAGKAQQDYRRNGFAVVEGVFSAAECAALRCEVARLETLTEEQWPYDITRVKSLSARQRAGISRSQAGRDIFMLGDLARYSDALRRAVADRRVAVLVRAVLGYGQLRYHFSNLTHKAPRVGPRVGPHRDLLNRLVTMPVARFCRTAICLDGMSAGNGGMVFRARSHRITDAVVRARARLKLHLRRPLKPVRCGVGAVVLFHPKVIHGSVSNRSGTPRRNLVVQYGVPYQRLIASQTERWTGHPPEDLRY